MRRPLWILIAGLLLWTSPASAQVSGPWAQVKFGSDSGPTISSGTGSPEGVVTATGGSLFLQTDGASGFTLWTKVGSGSTGWEAPSGGGGGTHNLLSATHPDTTAGAPVAGGVVCADSTPSWTRCTPLTSGQVLRFNGTTSAWSTDGTSLSIDASNLGTGTLPAARFPAFTGDVTTSAGSVATTIASDAVTTGKILDGTILFGDWSLNSCTAGQIAHVNAGATGWECADESAVSGGAPADASYFTATAESGLSNESNLGALTTGLLKLTVSAGTATPSTAAAGTDYLSPTGSETATNKTLGSGTVVSSSISWGDGVTQTFNPDATSAGINVGSMAGDPASPSNGDLWYDSAAEELTARINGSNVALGTGGTGYYQTVQDEGSGLTQRPTINFTGSGVSCADNSGSSRTDCTISSSGGSISQGAFASLPGTCTTGDVYFFTDSVYPFARCSATNTWSYFLNGKLAIPPAPVAGWTGLNNGSNWTATDGAGTIDVQVAFNASVNRRFVTKSSPATPYTVTFFWRALPQFVTNQTIDIIFSDGTKIWGLESLVDSNSANCALRAIYAANTTTNPTVLATFGQVIPRDSPWYTKLSNDGSTLTMAWSIDGVTYHTLYSESVGTNITPDRYGFGGLEKSSSGNVLTISMQSVVVN